MTHLTCTSFGWSLHQTEISDNLVDSIVARIFWIGVGLLRIGACELVFSGRKIQLVMTVTLSTTGLTGRMEGLAPLALLKL